MNRLETLILIAGVLHFGLLIEGVWPAQLGLDTILTGRLHQSIVCGLPIGQFDIRGDQIVLIRVAVFGAAAGG